MSNANYSLQYGATRIEYSLLYAKRKTLAIHVKPDRTVQVKAPMGTALTDIEAVVRKRANWILRHQRQFASYPSPTPPRQYVSGETHRYLGRQYRLKVIEAEKEWVKLSRGYLHVWTANKDDTARVKQLLDDWYQRQAVRVFQERLDACYPRVKRLGIPYPPLTIRTLKSRWGSCSPVGKITLNLKLIQTPKECIDYVVFHELCHLQEHNHGRGYYQLLGQVCPDWKERKAQLNGCEVV